MKIKYFIALALTFSLLFGVNYSVFSKVTSVNEINDLQPDNWAYSAVKNLVEKYGIQGYPDQTFKGNNMASRYEMAAALDEVALEIGTRLAQLGVAKADREDLQTVLKLQQEFRIELAAFKLRAEAIERKNLEQDMQISKHTARIEKIERVRNSHDVLAFVQSDQGGGESNAMSYSFRVRNDTEATYHEDNPESMWGEGKVFLRLIGAAGRQGPLESTIPTGNILNAFNDAASYDSMYNESTRLNGEFANTRATAFIGQALISQDIHLPNNGLLNLRGGLLEVLDYFDANAVANDETLQFSNGSFVNNRMFVHGYATPGGMFQWEQPLIQDKLNFSLKGAILAHDNVKLAGALGFIYEGGLQYFINGKEGNMRVGGTNGYINSSDRQFVSTRINDRCSKSIYLSFDQQLYKNTRVFARYGVSDSGTATEALNDVRQAFSVGAEFPVYDYINRRPNDVLGIAFGFATPIINSENNLLNLNPRSEKILEVYYRAQINDMLSIGPHFQAIYSPGGFRRPLTSIFGLRTYLSF